MEDDHTIRFCTTFTSGGDDMATVTGTPRSTPPRDPRVYHPLDQLRGIIRRYVVIEGILSVLIFLVVWYILALILDYGVFKVFTWDWVQDSPRWLRGALLAVGLSILAAILIFRIVRRLTTEFSYPALALVLERRFPAVLGDRLITAVELADVDQAARYGYSAEMIRKTIDEARERVGTVPVNDVFNWGRLRMMSLLVVGLLLGVLVAAYTSYAIAARSLSPVRAGWKLAHVSTILAERDFVLMDTPWPRRSLIELVDVPEKGIRVAKDGNPPRLRIRSYRWVIADRTRPDGWRPLMWSDVTDDLVGLPVPPIPFQNLNLPEEPSSRIAFAATAGLPAMVTTTNFPDQNRNLPSEASDWTVDSVWERARDSAAVRDKLSLIMGGDRYLELQRVFERLETLADDPAYGRRLRRLDPPSKVEFTYSGSRTAGRGSLDPEAHGEYAGEITGLKEDVEFVIRAEDYRTPPRPITLVPAPTLSRLSRVEYQPAYLHYAPPLGPDRRPLGYSSLSGLRQMMPESALSLTGDRSVFVVPAGTEVVITGVTELPIEKAYARPKVGRVPGARPGSAELVPLPVRDGNTFTIEFRGDARITSSVEFDLIYENEDRVSSTRQVLIQVTEDMAPEVRIAPEVIRKVGKFYQVTPRAKIPFNPESYIKDDSGLSKVEYLVSYWQEDTALGKALRASIALRGFIAPGGPGAMNFAAPLQSAYHSNAFRTLDKGDNRQQASFVLGQFNAMEAGVFRETEDHLKTLLGQPLASEKPNLVKRVTLKTELVEVANKLISPDSQENNSPRTAYIMDSTGKEPLRVKALVVDRRLEGNRIVKFTREEERTFRYYTALERQVRGDYFDVRALGLEVAAGEIQPQHQILLDIQATDTNFDTGPKLAVNTAGTPPGPINLLVVSPGDLLVEIGKEEEELGKKLDEAIQKLNGAKKKYEFVHLKNGYAGIEEVDAVKVRSKDTLQDVLKAKELIQTVAREFRKIERECIVNDLAEGNITNYGKIANRLERLLGETPKPVSPDESRAVAYEEMNIALGNMPPRPTFAETEKLMGLCQSQLEWIGEQGERIWADGETVTDALLELNRLTTELGTIRALLGESANKEKLRGWLRDLIGKQRQVGKEIKGMLAIWEADKLKPTPALGTVGPVFLAKGETKKIKQSIDWRQYKSDTLTVKLSSSDPTAVVVPPELQLDFETNTLSFEYELRAGTKEGEYTITLTPASGDKVEVKVTVR